MSKTLSVAAIKDGTVIDHIPAGAAVIILQLLKLFPGKHRVSLGLNFNSTSMGFKDLIKIENRFLTEKEAHDIAAFAPHATINTIKNYKLVSKLSAKMPEEVARILVCPNLRCITNCQSADTLFHVEEHKNQVLLRCHFCEKIFERKEIKDYRP
ncbi:MAG: aspartate carbamoyltransferase regulatory subunit [Verrucomicrobia bacterium]|nr:aspartate carbamoyltransferase regulatory subunit [Verrucomicrobiota bacterium]